ncbi:MAG TPA: hypothetical protein VGM77_10750 [Gemmatimonadales bacterium]|jgi:hypothetical protein
MRARLAGIAVAAAVSLAAVTPADAQWTVQPHGWFLSVAADKGTIPDRFDPGVGTTENGLDKVDAGLYFIYGLHEGLSVGLGQGFAHLEDNHNGTTLTTTGFGATGLFVMKRIAQGKLGVLSIQPRVDLPLLYNTADRPVLGPIKGEAEVRLLYGTGYGIVGRRGWISLAVGGSAWRHGNSEIRYDGTIGLDAGHNLTIMAQTFNVAALPDSGQTGIAYSATKIGGSLVYHVSPAVGIVGGYYAGISGKNTAREKTLSLGIWLTHTPTRQSPTKGP